MLLRLLFYLLWMLALGAWGWGPLKCGEIYQERPIEWILPSGERAPATIRDLGPLKRQTTEFSEATPETYAILRNVLRVFNEYPRDWVVRQRESTEIAIPVGRWQDIFKRPFQEAMRELETSQIYRTNTYASGVREVTQEGPLLLEYGPRRLESGEEVYFFRLDPRLVKLYDFHLEPAVVGMFIEDGLLMNRPI